MVVVPINNDHCRHYYRHHNRIIETPCAQIYHDPMRPSGRLSIRSTVIIGASGRPVRKDKLKLTHVANTSLGEPANYADKGDTILGVHLDVKTFDVSLDHALCHDPDVSEAKAEWRFQLHEEGA